MKKKPIKLTCECDDCNKTASYRCMVCDANFCKKCEKELWGECPFCEPRLIPIKNFKQ